MTTGVFLDIHSGRIPQVWAYRTGLASQMRGILAERGIVFAQSIARARREIPAVVADISNGLAPLAREMLADLMDQLRELDKRIAGFDRRIDMVFKASETGLRIAQIAEVGPKTATAIVAAMSDPEDFKNGRHFAAWLRLVPHQSSSGGRTQLLGTSKRGDRHRRTLLIHGARAVLRTAPTKHDRKHAWALALQARRRASRAIVAIANKMARVICRCLRPASRTGKQCRLRPHKRCVDELTNGIRSIRRARNLKLITAP